MTPDPGPETWEPPGIWNLEPGTSSPVSIAGSGYVVQEGQGTQRAAGTASQQSPGGTLGQVRELPGDPLQQGAGPQLQGLPQVRLPLSPLSTRAPADALRRREICRTRR